MRLGRPLAADFRHGTITNEMAKAAIHYRLAGVWGLEPGICFCPWSGIHA